MIEQIPFKRVGECLYRNPASRQYYAILKIRGKQIKRSLRTDDLAEARRKLRDFKTEQAQIDPHAGRMTVTALCDLQFKIIAGQAPKTVRRKTDILNLINQNWGQADIGRVKPSEIKSWLGSFTFGPASYNLYLQGIQLLLF